MDGGPADSICPAAGNPRGASWGPDGTIVFATTAGLQSVPARGGTPKLLTKADGALGESNHILPSVLPSGRAALFTITGGVETQVAILDLKTGQHKRLIQGGSQAEYVEPFDGAQGRPGYLVYAAAGTLRAVRFDPERYEVIGDSVALVEGIPTLSSGAAEYSLSRTGALVYLSGLFALGPKSLVWVNRQGREEPINAPPRAYFSLRLSPDGTRLALDVRDQENDVWIWDFERRSPTRLTLGRGVDGYPVWTPDSYRIVFSSQREGGVFNLYWQSANGTGAVERLTTSLNPQYASSISRDGKSLLVTEFMPSGVDVTLLQMAGKGSTTPIFKAATFNRRNAEISPDGRWLAYESMESAQPQIYVQPFPNVNDGRWPISTAGGTKPVWAQNGRELFYLDGASMLIAVPIETTPTFKPGNPTTLFEARNVTGSGTGRFYDVARDGQRFVLTKDAPADPSQKSPQPNIVVVWNWVEELKAKLGGR